LWLTNRFNLHTFQSDQFHLGHRDYNYSTNAPLFLCFLCSGGGIFFSLITHRYAFRPSAPETPIGRGPLKSSMIMMTWRTPGQTLRVYRSSLDAGSRREFIVGPEITRPPRSRTDEAEGPRRTPFRSLICCPPRCQCLAFLSTVWNGGGTLPIGWIIRETYPTGPFTSMPGCNQ